jgi:hypothetical protein
MFFNLGHHPLILTLPLGLACLFEHDLMTYEERDEHDPMEPETT